MGVYVTTLPVVGRLPSPSFWEVSIATFKETSTAALEEVSNS